MTSTGTGATAPIVRVWHAHTDVLRRTPDSYARASAWLTPAEHARHGRFRRDADRDMFLLGRVMSRALVGEALAVPPTSWPWREGSHGRPEIDIEHCPLAFNIAHSGGLVACAISWHGEVGVDIEDRRRPPIDHDLVRRCCAPAEAADVYARGGEGWQDRFLQYWTLKEAYLKARGLGIAVHLADLCFSLHADEVTLDFKGALARHDGPDWAFDLITLHADHFLAVAAPVVGRVRPVFRFAPFPLAWLP
jgi:4'-phosphopantetheinyl transferase